MKRKSRKEGLANIDGTTISLTTISSREKISKTILKTNLMKSRFEITLKLLPPFRISGFETNTRSSEMKHF